MAAVDDRNRVGKERKFVTKSDLNRLSNPIPRFTIYCTIGRQFLHGFLIAIQDNAGGGGSSRLTDAIKTMLQEVREERS